MEVTASVKYVRITPRKVRMVIDLVRGKKLQEAYAILQFTSKRAAKVVEKLLKSAQANAENNFALNKDDLYIKKIIANDGPQFPYRYLPRAMGRATPIIKRTSHISVVLDEIVGKTNKEKKSKEKVKVKEEKTVVKADLKKEKISKVKVETKESSAGHIDTPSPDLVARDLSSVVEKSQDKTDKEQI